MLDGGEDMDGQDMDIAIYLETGGVSANLVSNSAKHLPAMDSDDPFAAPGGGEDTLMNIENVKGSHMFDVLIGDGENNVLKGLDGGDRISGGAGDDTINGGDGVDTVSYEGEAATFEADGTPVPVSNLVINLAGAVVPAVEDNPDTNAGESMPAHITATLGTVADRIVVENKGSKEEPSWVSTIENVVGGGADQTTGDARSNVLTMTL